MCAGAGTGNEPLHAVSLRGRRAWKGTLEEKVCIEVAPEPQSMGNATLEASCWWVHPGCTSRDGLYKLGRENGTLGRCGPVGAGFSTLVLVA